MKRPSLRLAISRARRLIKTARVAWRVATVQVRMGELTQAHKVEHAKGVVLDAIAEAMGMLRRREPYRGIEGDEALRARMLERLDLKPWKN